MPLTRRSFLRSSAAAAVAPAFAHLPYVTADNSALCRKLAADPLRPQYHLLPAHNWMNDPNGPIFFKGRYHMFHQYNPQGAIWGNMNWAHATSPDMIHWTHEPIALSPTPNGPDRDGVFSGSAVLDNGKPTVIYTAVAPPANDAAATLRDGAHTWRETQCLAVAEDNDLRIWKKLPEPVIAAPPEGLDVLGFRDPCLWREGGQWMLILGSGIRGKGVAILLYSSPDLRHWTYLHPLVEGTPSGKNGTNPVDTGDMWECPDFFRLEDKHVLLISTMGKVHWKVGTYARQRFTPEIEGVVDWGSFYAAKTMLDKDGRRILWGWIPEARPDSDLIAAGWAGAMSLPRRMHLNSHGELQIDADSAVDSLSDTRTGVNVKPGDSGTSLDSVRIHDLCARITLRVVPNADNFTLRFVSEIGEFASIACVAQDGSRHLRVGTVSAPLPPASQGATAQLSAPIHIYLDGSILEVFTAWGVTLTARVYQPTSGPLRLKLEGKPQLVNLEVSQMKPISPDRLTGSLCR